MYLRIRSLIFKNKTYSNTKILELINLSLNCKMSTNSALSGDNTSNFRVYVSQPIPQQAIDIFNSNKVELVISDRMPTRQQLLESIVDADGLFCTLNEKVDKELLDAAKKLKVLFSNNLKTTIS
jgi:hypothetical protein